MRTRCRAATAASSIAWLLLLFQPAAVAGESRAGSQQGWHTGYLDTARPHTALFYWLVEHPHPAAPLVVWLQGGPGASSLFGLFVENGPVHILGNLSTAVNPYSWSRVANVLFIDNPAGTGFSTGTPPTSGEMIADDMQYALRNFYEVPPRCTPGSYSLPVVMQVFPRFMDAQLFIFGESFAGHMIPQIATRIQAVNQATPREQRIPLQGIGMGDGWTAPLLQNGAWAEYAASFGLVDQQQKHEIDAMYRQCKRLILNHEYLRSLQFCYSNLLALVTNFSGVDVYDIRRQASQTRNFSYVGAYLAQPDVHSRLGVGNKQWHEFSPAVEQALQSEYSRDVSPLVARLLDQGIRVLVYAGQYDLICCSLGVERWVHSLDWKGACAFDKAHRRPWRIASNEHLAGYVQSTPDRMLTSVLVHNAGHYVPFDQPAAAVQMLTHFLQNRSITPFE